jgi:thiol-disulfide isomerase/thioredoxin
MAHVRRIGLGLLALALVACGSDPAVGTILERVAEPLPRIEGRSVIGDERLSTGDFRGSILVINVWATWCIQCRTELPALARVARDYADRDVGFLGINYRDGRAGATLWIERDFRLPYPSIYDPWGDTAVELAYPAPPATYFVDEGGTIRYRAIGELSEERIRSTIDRMLAA